MPKATQARPITSQRGLEVTTNNRQLAGGRGSPSTWKKILYTRPDPTRAFDALLAVTASASASTGSGSNPSSAESEGEGGGDQE